MTEQQTSTNQQPDRNARMRKFHFDLSHLTVARKMLVITTMVVTVCFAAIVTI